MTLTDYVRHLALQRVAYGRCDCLLAVADWARELTGVDVGAPYRGTYDTQEGWRAIVDHAGGMVALVDEICPRIGLIRVTPEARDIGVIDLPQVGLIGAICTGDRWVMVTDKGLAAIRSSVPRVATAWGAR